MTEASHIAPLVPGSQVCTKCGLPHPQCKAHTIYGKPCMMPPKRGLLVCRKHGGATKAALAAAARRVALGEAIMAVPENRRLGVPLDVHPAEALLEQVREAAGNVAYLRWEVGQLEQGLEAGELETLEDGRVVLVNPTGGLAGRVDPGNWKVEPHVLVRMYNEERERLVKFAKLACDAGVAERLVRAVEQDAQEIVRVLQFALDGAELTPDQLQGIRARLREALGQADLQERELQGSAVLEVEGDEVEAEGSPDYPIAGVASDYGHDLEHS